MTPAPFQEHLPQNPTSPALSLSAEKWMQNFTPGLTTQSILDGISQTLRGCESPRRAESGEGTFTPSCKLVESFLNQALGLDAAPAAHLKSSSSTSLL